MQVGSCAATVERSLLQTSDQAAFAAAASTIPKMYQNVLSVVSQSIETTQLCRCAHAGGGGTAAEHDLCPSHSPFSNIIGHGSMTAAQALQQVLAKNNFTDIGDVYTQTYLAVSYPHLSAIVFRPSIDHLRLSSVWIPLH